MAGNLTAMIASIFSGGVTADPYYEYTTLLLPGNGTNGAQNNTFLDGSTNNFTITRNGNTTQGTFSPFSQTGWGNYLSGSSQYLSISSPPTNLREWWTTDFTIEAWIYPLNATNLQNTNAAPTMCGNCDTAGYDYWSFGPINSGVVRFKYYNGGTVNVDSTQTITINQWNHVAMTKTSSGITIFVNGVASSTTAVSGTPQAPVTVPFTIGANYTTSINAHISNLRAVKGRAVYTSNYTPPTSPLTRTTGGQNPPQGTECSLLTCQSNRFLDSNGVNTPASSPLTITPNGSPSVQAFSPFNPTASWSAATNGGSGYFDGNGDYLQLPAGTAFAPGTGDFTVDGWFYTTVTTANQIIWSQAVSGTNYFIVWADPSTSTVYFNGTLSGGGVNISSTANLQVNAWNYFSVRRASGTVTVYLNGVAGTPTSNTVDFSNTSYVPTIGRYTHAATNHFTGYIANLRYVKGTAITPSGVPTTLNTAVSGTSALLNFTNAGIYDATSKNDLETVGNAQISTAQSKWGGSSMYFDGTGDYVTSYNANALFRIGNIYTIELWFYTTTIAAGAAGLICLAIGASTNSGINIYRSGSEIICNDGATGGTGPSSGSSAITTNTWTHLAVVSDGTTTKMYIDGVLKGTYSGTTASSAALTYVTVGANGDKSAVLNGYIQDVRITKGIARYTANFTPPTAAFPTL